MKILSSVQKVYLCSPRGFCAGVEMAIKALNTMVNSFDSPVYCYHEIVHNKLVVEDFTSRGVIFVNDISEVPQGSPIMLSAHGSAPEVVAAAKEKGSFVVNAVCPLVTKVHHEVKLNSKRGNQIIYIGHDGHEEAVGTIAVAPDNIHRVESVVDVENLPEITSDTALLAQTTLSHRDWDEVAQAAKSRFPQLKTPAKSDLCFATTNRQEALLEIAQKCDVVVVIGSENSSNTNALAKLATEAGCDLVLRVNSYLELPQDINGNVGVTAGASAPERLVNEVLDFLNPQNGIEEVTVTKEEEYFPPPRELRELLSHVEDLGSLALGVNKSDLPEFKDKDITAQ